jgi:FHA domain
MSFYRLIFYHAMLGGWAALAGWFVSEAVFLRRRSGAAIDDWIVLTIALIGAAIAGGISLVGAVANGRFKGYELRLTVCLAGGLVGGALGGYIGNKVSEQTGANSPVLAVLLLVLGWMLAGLCIGSVEGILDRSVKKIRNGLLGGAVGGLLGGLCFVPVANLVGGNMSGRAIAFVVLGACIGLFIGLAQILLREAWLTVEQGFRPGRQFVLNIPNTILGTSEKSQLPFIAFGAKGVEPIHLRIRQQSDGTYLLMDNGSRTGTFVNGQRVTEEVLEDNDLIQLGPNTVRFREVVRHVSSEREAKRRPVKGGPPAPIAAALPEALPIVTPAPAAEAIKARTPPVPASGSITAAPLPLKPKPAMQPPALAPQAIKPAAPMTMPQPIKAPPGAAPRGKACPRCGKPGTPVPGTGNYLCMVCDLKY